MFIQSHIEARNRISTSQVRHRRDIGTKKKEKRHNDDILSERKKIK